MPPRWSFLLDRGVNFRTKPELLVAGFPVVLQLADAGLTGLARDPDIFAEAQRRRLILITKDTDFIHQARFALGHDGILCVTHRAFPNFRKRRFLTISSALQRMGGCSRSNLSGDIGSEGPSGRALHCRYAGLGNAIAISSHLGAQAPLSEGLLARESRKATRHTTIHMMSHIPALGPIHSNVIQAAHLLLRQV